MPTFFFFQAEDGIRDGTVTGVQTCALPISPADRPVGKAPMVGRDREMSLLASLWERAVGERRPHLVTMIGPPGIGKSRLHGEFASSVATDGGRVLRGR